MRSTQSSTPLASTDERPRHTARREAGDAGDGMPAGEGEQAFGDAGPGSRLSPISRPSSSSAVGGCDGLTPWTCFPRQQGACAWSLVCAQLRSLALGLERRAPRQTRARVLARSLLTVRSTEVSRQPRRGAASTKLQVYDDAAGGAARRPLPRWRRSRAGACSILANADRRFGRGRTARPRRPKAAAQPIGMQKR
jgi:hypothetical protein